MVATTQTDLTHATDLELDAALRLGYARHRAADPEDRLELHNGIVAIIAEQSTRLDRWLAARNIPA